MRRALGLMLALAACAPLDPAPTGWKIEARPGALELRGERGSTPVFTLVCRTDGLLSARAHEFDKVLSNEEFSFGAVDGSTFLMVVDLADRGPGVVATGRASPRFLSDLAAGRPIAALYGTQQFGPAMVPPAEAQDFASLCAALRPGG